MKKPSEPQELSEDEPATPPPDDAQDPGVPEGRSGEGAHSAMKHWLHEERNRLKRPEH